MFHVHITADFTNLQVKLSVELLFYFKIYKDMLYYIR